MATNVTVNFPQLSGKDAVMKIQKIYVPDETNSMGTLMAYTADGIPTHTGAISVGNLALIRLAADIPKFADMSKLNFKTTMSVI
jgi:hypothetical protein